MKVLDVCNNEKVGWSRAFSKSDQYIYPKYMSALAVSLTVKTKSTGPQYPKNNTILG